MTTAAPCSMYVRVKRANQTVFMYCEPGDSALHLKEKVGVVLKQKPEDIKLYFKDAPISEEAKTLGELNIENDNILYMCFRLPNGVFEPLIKAESAPSTTSSVLSEVK